VEVLLRVQVSVDEANRQFDAAQIYGALLTPPDFSDKRLGLLQSVSKPGELTRPVIKDRTQPPGQRDGRGHRRKRTGEGDVELQRQSR
jgi:hypothetical protein